VQNRKSKARIVEKLRPLVYSVRLDDVVENLPPLIDHKVDPSMLKALPMSDQQAKHYESALELWEIELESGELIEFNQVVARLQKLHQIANGFVYDEDHKVHEFDCPKLDAFVDFIKYDPLMQTKKKIVVWGAHTATIENLVNRIYAGKLGHAIAFYGGVTPKERNKRRETFQRVSDLRFFVAQVDMGVGMNELVVADTAHYFSNSFKVVSKQQSQARTRRIGSEVHEHILSYDWVTEKSMEVKQLYGVRSAMSYASWVMDQLKRGVPVRELVA
jgi:hypothetical protein